MPGHPLDFRAGELHAELLGDLLRYLLLGCQHVRGLEAVLVSPDLAIPVHINHLGADDEATPPPHQSAGQHRANFELLPGFFRTYAFALISLGGAEGPDRQLRKLREIVDDTFRNSVA